jgi:hypothetical protein
MIITAATARLQAPFTHRHVADYRHSVSTGWPIGGGRYGRTHATCRDCGQHVIQLVEAGMTGARNWHLFRSEAELAEVETAHEQALAADAARELATAPAAPDAPYGLDYRSIGETTYHTLGRRFDTYAEALAGRDKLTFILGESAEHVVITCSDPFAVETWNEVA